MQQLIEGIDNEVTFIFFVITLLVAVIVPFYVLRPSRQLFSTALFQDQPTAATTTTAATTSSNTTTTANNSTDIAAGGGSQSENEGPPVETLPSERADGSNIYPDLSSLDSSGAPVIPADNDSNVSASSSTATSSNSSELSLRVIHHENSQVVSIGAECSLADLKRKCFPNEYSENRMIRLIVHGRVLQGDHQTLRYLGIQNNNVLHASVAEQRTEEGNQSQTFNPLENTQILDLSGLLIPLLVLLMTILWGAVLLYSSAFSMFSIFGMSLLSLFFTTVYLVSG